MLAVLTEQPTRRFDPSDQGQRRAVVEDVRGRMDDRTRVACLDLLSNRNVAVAESAAHVLQGNLRPEDIDRVVSLMGDARTPTERFQAAYACRGTQDPRALCALVANITDRDMDVRSGAALGLHGVKDPKTVEALCQIIRSAVTIPDMHRAAIYAFMGTTDEGVRSLIRPRLTDPNQYVRKAALLVLQGA